MLITFRGQSVKEFYLPLYNMNYEQLILKNNSLNKIVVVLWFIFYVRLCANLQAVRRD